MGKHHAEDTIYQFSWDTVVTAFWRRYPNPFSTHVLTEDVLERYREGNQLISKRYNIISNFFVSVKYLLFFIVVVAICDLNSKRIYSASEIFGVHFLPRMKNVPKLTKMHLNEVGSTNTEFCKSPIQLRQPPIS